MLYNYVQNHLLLMLLSVQFNTNFNLVIFYLCVYTKYEMLNIYFIVNLISKETFVLDYINFYIYYMIGKLLI